MFIVNLHKYACVRERAPTKQHTYTFTHAHTHKIKGVDVLAVIARLRDRWRDTYID